MIDFEQQRLRGRFEAWVLAAGSGLTERAFGEHKRTAIGALRGTVVELGPGPGVNLRHYAPGVRVIAVEPNPAMHPRLRAAAQEHGVDLEVRSLRGEAMDVPDGSADAVVGTLLLCGVDDPKQVLREVRRVLRPGGTYVFVEHVVAPPGITRRVQAAVKRPHRWLFNGCEVDRDTTSALRAAGFGGLDVRELDLGVRGAWIRHVVVGTATA